MHRRIDDLVERTALDDTPGVHDGQVIGQALEESGRYGTIEATPGNRDNKGKLQFTVNIDRHADGDATTDVEEDG